MSCDDDGDDERVFWAFVVLCCVIGAGVVFLVASAVRAMS